VVLTVLSSFLRQSCLVFTNVTSALGVLKMLCAIINPRFTSLTYFTLYIVSCVLWPIAFVENALKSFITRILNLKIQT